ncbi:MAG: hypothetical protein HOP15_11800 [Planctomycetes bacterium]|nr:hypothetical protein [Planctomycetota bacterium]
MKNSRSLFALLVLAPLVLANDWALDKLAYEPKAGATLSKQFEVEGEMDLADMSLEVDGQDVSEMAKMEMAIKTTMKLSVTDRYEEVSGERPTKLVRTFEEISSSTHMSGNNPMTGPNEQDVPLESELEGTSVVFTWNEDDSAYEVAFEGEESGDESLLESLAEDMDLRGFLPTSEVAQGDTWTIPAEAMKAALAPSGDVKLRPGDESNPMSGLDQFSQNDMIGDLHGTFEATYVGTREEDGARVAVIQLKIEGRSAQDMTERMGEMKDKMKEGMPEGIDFDVSAMDLEYELEAEGELLWNLETNLASTLHLSGEMRLIVDLAMNMTMGDKAQSMDMSQTYTGSQTITLTTGE